MSDPWDEEFFPPDPNGNRIAISDWHRIQWLKAEVERLRADRDRWYRYAVALGHPSWEDAEAARAADPTDDSR